MPANRWFTGLVLALMFGCLPLSAAVLSGAFVPLSQGANVNLTAEGPVDWVHWGLDSATDVNRKSSVSNRIGSLSAVGQSLVQRLTTNYLGFAWTDGAPTPAITNSPAGLFVQGLANGFEITTGADAERRRLRIFVGVEAATGLFEAVLSDQSAPGYFDESLISTASLSNGVFIIDFAAASDGQALTVRFTAQTVFDAASGRVLLAAAALASNLPPMVQLVLPTNNASFLQSASIALAASASDGDGVIQRVEFYQNGILLGQVFDPPYAFQWDSVPPGSYTLTARAFDDDGVSSLSAPVTVTVLPNFAPTVTLTNPANFTDFSVPTGIVLGASAADVDGSVTNVAFFAGAVRLGEVTNSPYVLVWTNVEPGEFLLTALATDNEGATSVSPAVNVFFTQSGGYLTAELATVTEPVSLDAEGPADWVHWGLYTANSFNRKRGVVSQLGNYTIIGTEPAYPYSDNANTYSWLDGTPAAAVTNTATGVYVVGFQNGFGIQAPAGPTTNLLKVYVGAYAARGRLLAYLSDFSAPLISDLSVDNAGNGLGTVYTLHYAATAPGKTLRVRYLVDGMYASDGNVTLQAAALDTGNHPPSATVTNPPDGSTFLWPTNISISVAAADTDGSVTNLEFFRNGVKIGERTTAPYTIIWSNAAPGSHQLTARATDNRGVTFTARAADVFVTIGGGLLVASSAFPPAQVDLTATGDVDWTHWGLAKATSFNHRSGARTRISDVTKIGTGLIRRYADNFSGFSWSDGQPTPSTISTPTGIYLGGQASGFQIAVPADPCRRRLKVYVGLYGARSRFEAQLSDSSARSFVDTSLANIYGNNYRVYTIDYASATPGQQLIIRHTADELFDSSFGNVTFQGATLVDFRLLHPHWDNDAYRFRFLTLSNRTYTVQYSDVLPATNWQALETFPGTDADVWIMDSLPSAPQRFYRVMEH